MKTKLCLGIFIVAATLAHAQTNDLTALLQQGLFEEQANRNLDAAIAVYQNLTARFDQDRQLAATAVFRMGECYRAQGRTNEAAAQYERILHDFSDQQTLATLSREDLVGMGMGLGHPTAAPHFQERLQPLSEPKPAGAEEAPAGNFSDEAAEIRAMEQMVRNSPDLVNAPTEGCTPLVKAAYHGWLNVAGYLLDHGADVNLACGSIPGSTETFDTSRASITPLVAAVAAGNKAMTELLIGRGAKVNYRSHHGDMPLHWAVRKVFPAVAEVLLDNRAEVNVTNSEGMTPLFYAVQGGQIKTAKRLLAAGAEANFINASGQTAWNYALGASPDMWQALLDAGTHPNTVDSKGRTPLSYATEGGYPELVKFLLAAKADPNAGTLDVPLLCAIYRKDEVSAEQLLQAGANPNAKGNTSWNLTFGHNGYPNGCVCTPLALAVAEGQLSLMQLLLKFKADPNVAQTNDQPLLFLALSEPEILRALLDAGADVNALEAISASPFGGLPVRAPRYGMPVPILHKTLLQEAVSQNQAESVELLLQHGADPGQLTEQGDSALHFAAQALADESIFNLLLDHKANPNIRNLEGKTPLAILEDPQNATYSLARFKTMYSAQQHADKLIALLHAQGALDVLPDWDRITFSRPASKFSTVLFEKNTNDWNHFSLLEAIYQSMVKAGYSSALAFPDFGHIIIARPTTDTAPPQRIKVNLLNETNGWDFGQDMPLKFGDLVEIPEREHSLAEPALGMSTQLQQALLDHFQSLAGEARLVVQGGPTVALPLEAFNSEIGKVLQSNSARAVLTSASDLSRVKVTRHDAITNKTETWTLDCINLPFPNSQLTFAQRVQAITQGPAGMPISHNPEAFDLWLRAGDVIEVPLKNY
jgi:cytohesin